MATVFPSYPASTLAQAEDLIAFTGNQLSDIINGDALSEVETLDGFIPTIRKTIVDNFNFKSPIAWSVGSNETVFNQLRVFTDGSWWYAPLATTGTPVAMGADPYSDSNWLVFSKNELTVFQNTKRLAAEAGYNLVGTFRFGCTITTALDVVLNEKDGLYYSWGGTLPRSVAAGSSPVPESPTAWVDRSDLMLRGDISHIIDIYSATITSGEIGSQLNEILENSSGDLVLNINSGVYTHTVPVQVPAGRHLTMNVIGVVDIYASVASRFISAFDGQDIVGGVLTVIDSGISSITSTDFKMFSSYFYSDGRPTCFYNAKNTFKSFQQPPAIYVNTVGSADIHNIYLESCLYGFMGEGVSEDPALESCSVSLINYNSDSNCGVDGEPGQDEILYYFQIFNFAQRVGGFLRGKSGSGGNFYRCGHAMDALTTSKGVSRGATYGKRTKYIMAIGNRAIDTSFAGISADMKDTISPIYPDSYALISSNMAVSTNTSTRNTYSIRWQGNYGTLIGNVSFGISNINGSIRVNGANNNLVVDGNYAFGSAGNPLVVSGEGGIPVIGNNYSDTTGSKYQAITTATSPDTGKASSLTFVDDSIQKISTTNDIVIASSDIIIVDCGANTTTFTVRLPSKVNYPVNGKQYKILFLNKGSGQVDIRVSGGSSGGTINSVADGSLVVTGSCALCVCDSDQNNYVAVNI